MVYTAHHRAAAVQMGKSWDSVSLFTGACGAGLTPTTYFGQQPNTVNHLQEQLDQANAKIEDANTKIEESNKKMVAQDKEMTDIKEQLRLVMEQLKGQASGNVQGSGNAQGNENENVQGLD